MAGGRRLGAGLLRLGGVALSLVAYSYLELLPLRHQPAAGAAGARLSSLIVGTLGEYAPALGAGEWGRGAGAAVPPMLKRLWLNHLPFVLLLLLLPALALPGTTLLGVNAIYFYGCLVAAALRDPLAPSPTPTPTIEAEGSGGGWTNAATMLLFLASALIYWMEPGGGNVHSEDRVRFRPFEAEIRQLLLRHDPGKLHLVDGWLQAHRWNPRKLYRDLQTQYETTAAAQPQPQPAAAAQAPAAAAPTRTRIADTTTTTAAASSYSPSSMPGAAAAAVGGYGGYGGRRQYQQQQAQQQQAQQQQGAYGAYDDEEEEEYGDEGTAYHDTHTTAASVRGLARGEEKASASASSYRYQRGGGGGGGNDAVRGSAVSAVMAATRDYQEGILARQQHRISALRVSSSPPRPNHHNRHAHAHSQPAGGQYQHQQQPFYTSYSQR